jgi:hypothetical protein
LARTRESERRLEEKKSDQQQWPPSQQELSSQAHVSEALLSRLGSNEHDISRRRSFVLNPIVDMLSQYKNNDGDQRKETETDSASDVENDDDLVVLDELADDEQRRGGRSSQMSTMSASSRNGSSSSSSSSRRRRRRTSPPTQRKKTKTSIWWSVFKEPNEEGKAVCRLCEAGDFGRSRFSSGGRKTKEKNTYMVKKKNVEREVACLDRPSCCFRTHPERRVVWNQR